MTPYTRVRNRSRGKGISWDNGHISYSELHTVLQEAVAGCAHLYAYGTDKSDYLSDMINRTFPNLEDFNCPQSRDLKSDIACGFLCHKVPSTHCATLTVQCLYEWLMYHFQTNIGGPRKTPVILTSYYLSTLSQHLPKVCENVCE